MLEQEFAVRAVEGFGGFNSGLRHFRRIGRKLLWQNIVHRISESRYASEKTE